MVASAWLLSSFAMRIQNLTSTRMKFETPPLLGQDLLAQDNRIMGLGNSSGIFLSSCPDRCGEWISMLGNFGQILFGRLISAASYEPLGS